MVTTWVLDCVFIYNGAENTRTTSLILYAGLDWAYRGNETRKAIFSRYFETANPPPSLLALLQCFNRFAASLVNGAHTIQLSSTVVAQLVNFFLRLCVKKAVSCAAIGIHRAVYFIQTLEAMFAASITAKKNGALF